MKDANWLEPWLDEISVLADSDPVLELGCGQGRDTATLTAREIDVVSVDLDLAALAICGEIDRCLPLRTDIARMLPFRDNTFAFVLASLSLHYFAWQETTAIIGEICRVLTPGGVLLVRVNSTGDVNYGAGRGEEIEPRYSLIDGQKKRFFSKGDVESVLDGMQVDVLRHESIDRYTREKRVWLARAVNVCEVE